MKVSAYVGIVRAVMSFTLAAVVLALFYFGIRP